VSAESDFRNRARPVGAFLRSLGELEQQQLVRGRGFYRGASAIAASRAAAFIMIYNCVEHAVRQALVGIRIDIVANVKDFGLLRAHWKEEIIKAHFQERLQQGTKHDKFLRDIAKFLPGEIDWKNRGRDLPFSGNIDHQELFRLIERLELSWKPPRKSLGGSDLQLVRQTRNELAHGEESFEAIGSRYQTQDVIQNFIV
jgi:hypothetical protein